MHLTYLTTHMQACFIKGVFWKAVNFNKIFSLFSSFFSVVLFLLNRVMVRFHAQFCSIDFLAWKFFALFSKLGMTSAYRALNIIACFYEDGNREITFTIQSIKGTKLRLPCTIQRTCLSGNFYYASRLCLD